MRRVQPLLIACAVLLALFCAAARSDETPAATIRVSSATAGSSLGSLVEGVMSFRGRDYLLRLRNVIGPARTQGSVYGLLRAGDIEGAFAPSDEGLRNGSGVIIRFDPPLETQPAGLKVELAGQLNKPKLSGSEREGGAE